MQIFAYLFDDRTGCGGGGVRKHTGDIIGKFQASCHQHRGCAHGKTGQNDGRFLAKSFIGILYPALTVSVFLDAKTNGRAIAPAVGALIDHQGIKTHLP